MSDDDFNELTDMFLVDVNVELVHRTPTGTKQYHVSDHGAKYRLGVVITDLKETEFIAVTTGIMFTHKFDNLEAAVLYITAGGRARFKEYDDHVFDKEKSVALPRATDQAW